MTSLLVWFVLIVAEAVGGIAAAPMGPQGNGFFWLIGVETVILAVSAVAEFFYRLGKKKS
jgi:hypothetical protein